MTELSTRDAWRAVLGELQLQMPRSAFETWLRQTEGVSYDDQYFIVEAPTPFAVAWLERRMYQAIQKTVEKVVHRPLEVQFQVRGGESISSVRATNPADQLLEADAPPTGRAYETQYDPPSFHPRYTFDSFVVGSCNELAFSTAQVVADSPGQCYTPLFLYSGVGVGKTHLLQAIGNEVLKKYPNKKVLYVSSEKFTNDFIKSISSNRTEKFKYTYRGADILLIDDIQFLAGKEGTQEAFFHTFNDLHQANKQVVLTSDRQPKAIPALESRLVSRFEWGMTADISAPDLETRAAILRTKCKERNYELSDETITYIATQVQNNVRELEGAINKIIAHHQLNGAAPTHDNIKKILVSITSIQRKRSITPKQIINLVSEFYDIKIEDLLGGCRKKIFSQPRQIVMYLMREELKNSYPTIGQEIGNRDHTTAIHAHLKISQVIDEDEKINQDVKLIKEKLYN